MKCIKCGGNINKKSFTCESCGTKYKNKKNNFIWFIIILLLIGISAFFLIDSLKTLSYEEIKATAIKCNERSASEDVGTKYYVIYEYTVNSQKYQAKLPEAYCYSFRNIYYDVSNPSNYSKDKITGVTIGIAVLDGFLMIGLIAQIVDYKRLEITDEQKETDQKKYERIASLEKITFNHNIYGNVKVSNASFGGVATNPEIELACEKIINEYDLIISFSRENDFSNIYNSESELIKILDELYNISKINDFTRCEKITIEKGIDELYEIYNTWIYEEGQNKISLDEFKNLLLKEMKLCPHIISLNSNNKIEKITFEGYFNNQEISNMFFQDGFTIFIEPTFKISNSKIIYDSIDLFVDISS